MEIHFRRHKLALQKRCGNKPPHSVNLRMSDWKVTKFPISSVCHVYASQRNSPKVENPVKHSWELRFAWEKSGRIWCLNRTSSIISGHLRNRIKVCFFPVRHWFSSQVVQEKLQYYSSHHISYHLTFFFCERPRFESGFIHLTSANQKCEGANSCFSRLPVWGHLDLDCLSQWKGGSQSEVTNHWRFTSL